MAALSPRARRALTLMFLAVAVIGATAVYYLRPSSTLELTAAAPSSSRPYPIQRANDIVFYNFVSFALGWAAEAPQPRADQAGDFSLFKTVDAGKHWQRKFSGHSAVIFTTLSTFRAVDASHGFVVAGEPLALHRTTDGGEHWSRLALPTQDVLTVQFSDAVHLWLFAGSRTEALTSVHMYASSDRGESWTQRPDVSVNSFPVFRNGVEGWAGASDQSPPHIFVTADGGLTWERRELPVETDTPQPAGTAVRLLPGTGAIVIVYLAGDPGGVAQFHSYTSMDGGRSWSAIVAAGPSGDQGFKTDYAFQDATHWWSVQDAALYKTADAGRSWALIAVEPTALRLLQAFDSRHAWGQLDAGNTQLVSTSDGGLHWNLANVPIAQ